MNETENYYYKWVFPDVKRQMLHSLAYEDPTV